MDSFFGIGSLELLVILIIAGIVMGPARIAKAAKWLGNVTAHMQGISRGFAKQLRDELDAIDDGGDLKEALRDVRDLQREVASLRQEILTTTSGTVKEGQEAIKEGQSALKNTIQPPKFSEEPVDEVGDGRINGQSSNGTAVPEKTATPPPPPLPNLVDVQDDPE